MGSSGCATNTPLDWGLLAFTVAASIPFILANGVIVVYRKRKFFQVQGGVMLILGGSFAGLMWIMSSFVVNGHFDRRHSILKVCKLWTFWLHGTLGPSLWLSCTVLRLHRILHISNRNADVSNLRYLMYVLLSLAPAIALSIGAIIAKANKDGDHDSKTEICKLNTTFEVLAWVVLVAPYLVIYVVLLYRLRSVKRRDPILVNEYNQTCEYIFMACVIILLTGVTYLTEGHRHPPGRLFLTFCECCLVFTHFWARLGWPVYLCVFKPKSEMDSFENELRQSGGRTLDLLQSVYTQRSPNATSSEGAVLEAFTKAVKEVENCKAKIRELQQLKDSLDAKVRDYHIYQ